MNKALWICVIFMLACTEFEIVNDHHEHFHETPTTVVVKDNFQTVGDVIRARRCSTGPLSQLDMQIALEMECLGDSLVRRIDDIQGLRFGDGVRPFLQVDAALALKRVVEHVGSLTLNSGWRSVAQQMVLKEWEGSCGIGVAATPGRSFHQSGLAIDTGNYRSQFVRQTLAENGFTWYCDDRNGGRLSGCADPVHFEHRSGDDLRGIAVLAFQKLWNRNHPNDQLVEDGQWGRETAERIRRSPVAGFRQVATCNDVWAPTRRANGDNICGESDYEASGNRESCSADGTWRCACSIEYGETVSQVCRDGVWTNHHFAPADCGTCNEETSEGCHQDGSPSGQDAHTALQLCGDSGLTLSETQEPCPESQEDVWRCTCSVHIEGVVSQVCRDGRWLNYRLDPQDCSSCQGDYSSACEPE